MGAGRWGWIGALTALLAAPATAQAPTLPNTAPPDWFDPTPVSLATQSATAAGDVALLLFEQQVRLGPAPTAHAVVYRTIERAQTLDGVGQIAQVELTYDPSFERIALHTLDVVRDGVRTSRLRAVSPRFLQREPDLSRRIYDGQISALLVLPDIRLGDVLEIVYSTTGQSPALGARSAVALAMVGYRPPGHVRLRVLAPVTRALAVDVRRPEALGTSDVVRDGWRDRRWWATGTFAATYEGGEPNWFASWPRVQVADRATWDDLRAHERGLFEPAIARGGPELAARTAAIEGDTAEAKLLAAVRFVQRDIRYFAVALGESALVPHPAADVLGQRFGDCKDKSTLLTAILRGLGFEAAPALVHTQRRRALDDTLPQAGAFDHVIVWTRVRGVERWFDATDDGAHGDLDHRTPPDFERALVLDGRSGGLTTIPSSTRASTLETEEHFLLVDAPQRLRVTTRATGDHARVLRRSLSGRPHAELARDYLEHYARAHPSIHIDQPLEVRDDELTDTVEVIETYTLTDFWDGDRHDFATDGVAEPLHRPRGLPGANPLAVAHPQRRVHRAIVDTADRWRIDDATERIDAPGFTWTRSMRADRTRLVVEHTYASKTDVVPPAQVAEELAARGKAYDALGGWVRRPDARRAPPEEGIAVKLGIAIGLMITAFIVGVPIYFVYRLLRHVFGVTPEPPGTGRRRRRFAAKLGGEPGDTAATALATAPPLAWYAKRKCASCGAKGRLQPTGRDTAVLGDARLTVITATCGVCQKRASIFVRASSPG